MHTRIMSTRIDEEIVRQIDQFSKDQGLDRAAFLKKLIIKGLQEYRLEFSVQLYRNKKITLSKAAESANISLHEFISLMPEKDLTLNYTAENLEEDLILEV